MTNHWESHQQEVDQKNMDRTEAKALSTAIQLLAVTKLKPMDAHWINHFSQKDQETWGQDFEYLIYERLTTKFTKKSLVAAGVMLEHIPTVVEPANLNRPKSPWNWRWLHIQRMRDAEAAKEPKTIKWNGAAFEVRFGYNQQIVTAIKNLPKWGKWDGEAKMWRIPAEPANAEALKNIIQTYGFDTANGVFERLDELESTPTSTIELAGDSFLVRFDYNSALVNQMRIIPKAVFDRQVKAWRFPARQTPLGLRRLREFAERNQEFVVTAEALRQMNIDQVRFCPSCERDQAVALFAADDYICQICRGA